MFEVNAEILPGGLEGINFYKLGEWLENEIQLDKGLEMFLKKLLLTYRRKLDAYHTANYSWHVECPSTRISLHVTNSCPNVINSKDLHFVSYKYMSTSQNASDQLLMLT